MKFNLDHKTAGAKIISLIALIFLVHLAAITSCTPKTEKKVITLNTSNFSDVIGKGIVLVDFWATWCMPCKVMAPAINEIAAQTAGKVTVGKVDIDANGSLANQYGIQAIPTLIIFRDGQAVERLTGVKSKAVIMEALSKYTSLE